jgi:hypothetical protein
MNESCDVSLAADYEMDEDLRNETDEKLRSFLGDKIVQVEFWVMLVV